MQARAFAQRYIGSGRGAACRSRCGGRGAASSGSSIRKSCERGPLALAIALVIALAIALALALALALAPALALALALILSLSLALSLTLTRCDT